MSNRSVIDTCDNFNLELDLSNAFVTAFRFRNTFSGFRRNLNARYFRRDHSNFAIITESIVSFPRLSVELDAGTFLGIYRDKPA